MNSNSHLICTMQPKLIGFQMAREGGTVQNKVVYNIVHSYQKTKSKNALGK